MRFRFTFSEVNERYILIIVYTPLTIFEFLKALSLKVNKIELFDHMRIKIKRYRRSSKDRFS